MTKPLKAAFGWTLGDVFRERGLGKQAFSYTLIAIEPYTRRDGGASALLTWRGECARCGAGFTIGSGRRPRSLIRTCKQHRGTLRQPATTTEGAANG